MEPFETVVERYGALVLRVCRAVVGPDLAQDAWSETFLSAMTAYPRLRPGSDVRAWLVTVAHRKAVDQVRAAVRRPVPVEHLPAHPAAPDPTPDDELWTALAGLSPKQRQCVAYHHVVGLPYAEVARIVGGSEAAARRAAADGIAVLRRTLHQEVSP